MRSLQRLFAEHVGCAPKWAIRIFRLNDAARRITDDLSPDYAGLAVQLGYSDQSHFIRDFARGDRAVALGVRSIGPRARRESGRRHALSLVSPTDRERAAGRIHPAALRGKPRSHAYHVRRSRHRDGDLSGRPWCRPRVQFFLW